ncbi:hypothetical protein [Yersinia pekkanenii]|uniref:Alpha-related fimbriae major subunit n=1 Tax=Yersinia pekkanenii TaxID=1288385 RepID=A0A0T9NQN1_9GAMM|nr:hypothetical protein [Yersinia pekkanenii]CNH25274.1 alpha-related fimbriae major subunit [Yersinia pekkanenii]CRY67210.1 alpha-related fimbriae major subunit [Yersinia pekkanenii]
MKVKNKLFFMGLLWLIIQPIAIANPYFYPYIQRYSNCSITVLEDNSVQVSFRAHHADTPFDPHKIQYNQGRGNIPNSEAITLTPNQAMLSIYVYKTDGTPDLSIPSHAISDIYLNGINPISTNNNTQNIKFDGGSDVFSNTYYDVSFRIAANALQSIRIGATVGGVLNIGEQQYSLFSSNGVSFGSSGKQCAHFYPQTSGAPDEMTIDPKFSLSPATWQLGAIQLDELLNTDTHSINHEQVEFCINYQTRGIRETAKYNIQINNLNGLSPNSNYFQLKDGDKVIHYQIEQFNYDGSVDQFPNSYGRMMELATLHQIPEQSVNENICFSAEINLFSTETTDKGSYSDTLNFTITPLS